MVNLKELFIEIDGKLQEFIIKYNTEKWNFFTNATSENRKQFYYSIVSLLDYINYDDNFKSFIKLYKKSTRILNTSEKQIAEKILHINFIFSNRSQLMDDLINAVVDFQQDVINRRIQYNSKYSTTNYIADLCERENSINKIKTLQKEYFFQPVNDYKKQIIKIVNLKNKFFQTKKYKNYLDFFLKQNDLTLSKAESLIAKVDKQTLMPYKKLKNELEDILVRKFNYRSKKLSSHIYGDPLFRRYPVHLDENVNIMFKGKDIAYTIKKFYENLGVNFDSIYDVSDLYVRPGKYQNPFIVDINRKGDIRFSLNAKSNFRGINNVLKYLAKVIYLMNINQNVPFLLKDNPDRGLMETFSMFMTNYAFKSEFIYKIIAQYEEEDEQLLSNISDYLELSKLVNIRFHLALSSFQLKLYDNLSNPTDLWTKAVGRYQLIDKNILLEKDSWAMIDSIIIDPFSSIFELQGFLALNKMERSFEKKQIAQSDLINYFCEKLLSKGHELKYKDIDKIFK